MLVWYLKKAHEAVELTQQALDGLRFSVTSLRETLSCLIGLTGG